MSAAQPIDAGQVASRVWESLQAQERSPLWAPGTRPPAAGRAGQAVSLPELAAVVAELAGELERLREAQRQLAQQVLALAQQLQILPGYIMRFERWTAEADGRLTRLDGAVEAVGAASALDGAAGGPPGAAEDAAQADEATEWRSVKQVAQQLSLSEGTVRRYVRSGKLPAVRLPGGRGLRLPWSDVVGRLTEAERGTEAAPQIPET